MHIAIGADHGGYNLKQHIAEFLIAQGHRVEDLGTHRQESVDYPDIAAQVARAVADGEAERGIIVCGSGIGVSMAANKIRTIRAALCTNRYMARMAREHNHANVCCLGGRVIGPELAKAIVTQFIRTLESEAERHVRRTRKVKALEAQ